MKVRATIFFLVCFALYCGGETNGVPPGTQDLQEMKSSLERVKNPSVPEQEMEALALGNAQFAVDAYKYLALSKKNIFISPLSISIALAEAYGGAKGKTADEMAQTLHFSLPQERLHPAFNLLDQTLESRADVHVDEGEPFKLAIVNAIWGQKGYPFQSTYLDLLATNYGAGLWLVDFLHDAEAARLLINKWVEDETYGRIKDLLGPGSITEMTRMVLTNAIHFKAGWLVKFDPKKTSDAEFTLLDGSTKIVKMMFSDELNEALHAKTDDYEALFLPYVGKQVGMFILLPAPDKFGFVEESLDGKKLLDIIGDLRQEEGTVALPHIDMEMKISMKDALVALGMKTPFSPDADFTGISETGELFIGDVVHQTFLKVDEEGTEAAGATAVVFVGTSYPPPEPFHMVVDRPFIFAIVDMPTKTVLFLGRSLDPEVSS